MEVKIYRDHQQLSENAANEIINLVKSKPNAALCLASGETPRLTCQLLVQKAKEQDIDFSRVNFFGLDEWVGIPPTNPGSCHYFFENELFAHLNFSNCFEYVQLIAEIFLLLHTGLHEYSFHLQNRKFLRV